MTETTSLDEAVRTATHPGGEAIDRLVETLAHIDAYATPEANAAALRPLLRRPRLGGRTDELLSAIPAAPAE
ncbi:hypothetical protein ACWKSP_32620 [Micromonosporaceae bacterium Da 78-11]